MASHSRSSKNREGPTYDLENLDYGERNEINDLELEEDDDVEIMESNPSHSSNPNPTPTSERKLKSPVWLFFTLNDDKNQAKCNICSFAFSYKGGGNNTLKRHIINKHKGVWEAGTAEAGGPVQSKISASTGTSVGTFLYNQKKMREGLARFVCASDMPFTLVEEECFTRFIQQFLQPAYKPISRNTLRSDIQNVFQQTKKKLIEEFSTFNCTIACTSDLWTGCNKTGYICITAHFVDENWNMNKNIIAFRALDYPHTSENIFNYIFNVFQEYDITSKIISITFDNASANTSAINMFKDQLRPVMNGKLFHGRCVCHIINLLIQDGLSKINDHIAKIREAVVYCCATPTRVQAFLHCCKQNRLNPRKLQTDIKTRWNSTYLMIESCKKYSGIITQFVNVNYPSLDLTSYDWDMAFEFHGFLEVFYNATNKLSGVYYSTSCLVLMELLNMAYAFSNYKQKNEIYVDICKDMEKKFKKYWSKLPPVFYLSAILDPRLNFDGVCEMVKQISDLLQGPEGEPGLEITNSEMEFTLETLFRIYYEKHANKERETTSSTSNVELSSGASGASYAAQFLSRKKQKGISQSFVSSSNILSELNKYRETEWESRLTNEEMMDLNLLTWWKEHVRAFPVLSIMARDLLTPPASTVASESAFSIGGRVLEERRSRLSPDMLDCLMCLKDWDRAQYRTQNREDEIIDDFSNLDVTQET